MKLVILVPSPDYLSNAGARIRYARLEASLASIGVELSLTPIDVFDPLTSACDVVVISKVYDARGLVAAAALTQRGVSVGIDIFDDYFSQREDPRLSRYRRWLQQILPLTAFALCSTPVLQRVISRYRADLPIHVLSDPAPQFDADALVRLLRSKFADLKCDGVMRVSWFGIGDNPTFPLGISDVADFSGILASLHLFGLPIDLTILTNRRALDARALAMLRQLPVRATVEDWSEQRENDLLSRCFLCFLPVSAQPFSIAKSLNRALTALTHGCQVLSMGYPLYADLHEWLYREPRALVDDLAAGRTRLSPASVPAFQAKIAEVAPTAAAATSLRDFLNGVRKRGRPSPEPDGPLALLHGFATTPAAHAAIKQVGGISVGTPFCTAPLEFDAVIELARGAKTSLLVTQDAASRLKPEFRRQARVERLGGRKCVRLFADRVEHGVDQAAASLPLQIALYEPVIEQARTMVSEAFGSDVPLLSEDSPLQLEPAI